MNLVRSIVILLFGATLHGVADDPVAALADDRGAIERVYYRHRTGTKPAFEQALPRAQIEVMVKLDIKKAAVLRKVYGLEITPAMIAAEVRRIHTTTRAPEILLEIKHALGDDAGRFAISMARPIIVERELHHRFDNDDKLHAAQRREAEQARTSLLAGQTVKNMRDVTWQLGKTETGKQEAEISAPLSTINSQPSTSSSGAYSVEATAQLAQVIASPNHAAPGKEKLWFEDLDPELQNVLRAQLQKPGDVSAVIETPGRFLVFLARQKTAAVLDAASLTIPKRSYDEWLAHQPEP